MSKAETVAVAEAADEAGGSSTVTPRRQRRWKAPRWAWVCTVLGAVLILLSSGVLVGYRTLVARYEGAINQQDLFDDKAAQAAPKKSTITGPLNILLVGVDVRPGSTNAPLADSIMILSVDEDLQSAFLFSLPRDLLVEIPAFPKADFHGGTYKLNSAMAEGSLIPGAERPDTAAGFELLAKTVSAATGIERFDAGAIINFSGFRKIVDAMGGVEMYIERDVVSEHRKPDGTHRDPNPYGEGYVGPQAQYKKGTRQLNGWQALDYVRQRYPANGVPDADYGRQRHQQQFIKAMAAKATSADVIADPLKLDRVLRAAGESLIFSGRGNGIAEFAYALRGIRPEAIQMIKLPATNVGVGDAYQGEQFLPVAQEFFTALGKGQAAAFVVEHPGLISTTQ
ncbi:LCP family protein [Melissospora conviva]|uniref:LCP family protein n=1 Tax=Melissospora conviva TaxID=3388432 RepID=UPI003B775CC5